MTIQLSDNQLARQPASLLTVALEARRRQSLETLVIELSVRISALEKALKEMEAKCSTTY